MCEVEFLGGLNNRRYKDCFKVLSSSTTDYQVADLERRFYVTCVLLKYVQAAFSGAARRQY